jgi:hypothetical protein
MKGQMDGWMAAGWLDGGWLNNYSYSGISGNILGGERFGSGSVLSVYLQG